MAEIDEKVLSEVEEVFRQFLHGRGLKYTPERRTLLREVLGLEEHFEAEQLLFSLRQDGHRVAKATIYRTLPLLVECGLIQQVQFGDNLARYEPTFRQAPHDHMICRRCRRVFEFSNDEVARLRAEIADRHGFRPLSHRFQITGICAECVQNNAE